MPAHKHADVIKAWADGAKIERHKSEGDEWLEIRNPSWYVNYEYRVKPVPHKWQKEMDAAKAGKTIQYKYNSNHNEWTEWIEARRHVLSNNEAWDNPNYIFRIEPKTVVRYMDVGASLSASFHMHCSSVFTDDRWANLKLTFEDNTLIAAEILPVVVVGEKK